MRHRLRRWWPGGDDAAVNAPVWTRLHHIDEDFSGLGDIRIPVSLRLDALIGSFVVFAAVATVAVKTGSASWLTGHGLLGGIGLIVVLFGIPTGVYRYLNSTHPDGRGRLRRLVHLAVSRSRTDLYPTDRCGRDRTRTGFATAGHVRRGSTR